MKAYLQLTVFLFCSLPTQAQYLPHNQEISIGAGIFSSEQIFDGTTIGFLAPTMKQYANTAVTGTWFAGYKFFLNRCLTVGVFAGVEKEKGAWIYDNMMGKPDDWSSSTIGTFSRTAYTVALEMSFTYFDREDVRIYSTIGAGAVYKREADVYNSTINTYQSYPGYGSQTVYAVEPTGYYSPLGLSFGGNLRGFFELGIGYKGIINGGICYKFNTLPKRLKGVPKHSAVPVIILPHDLPVGSEGLTYLDHVRSCGIPSKHHAGFEVQLAKVASRSQQEGANVFYVSDIRQRGEADRYSIRGTAFYAANYDSFKTTVAVEKTKPFKDEQCAYVVVYCPRNPRPDHRRLKASIALNDTGSVSMSWNSKYELKLTREETIVISTDKNKVTVHPKFGKKSYIRLYLRRKKSWVHIVDDVQGELETSVIGKPGDRDDD